MVKNFAKIANFKLKGHTFNPSELSFRLQFLPLLLMEEKNFENATLAGGCFWCTEAVFQRIKGVKSVISGYAGGTIKKPAYREVITGRTGHAEAIELKFDPEIISFREILYIFFGTHDPTTLNRQQNDVGTQYRSSVFYHSEEQKNTTLEVIKELEDKGIFNDKIVTEVVPASDFYKAEVEHQEYYKLHRQQPYCQYIIDPKIESLKKAFPEKLKQ